MKIAAFALAIGAAYSQSLTQVLSSRPDLSSLAGLVGNVSGLATSLGSATNITLLAPNNAAIAAALNTSTGMALAANPTLLQAVLQYHVLMGNYPSINSTQFIPTMLSTGNYANVTGGQRVEAMASGGNVTFVSGLLQNSTVASNGTISFSGGTIHVINKLLTLPQNVSATAIAANLTSAAGAITTLNLTNLVNKTPDLTLFVPNNAAFQAIGGTIANLTTQQLTAILAYHVVPGVVYSTSIKNGTSVKSYGGGNLTLQVVGGSVYVNSAKVVVPNVLVANGVVHVIDSVLNPASANSTVSINTGTTTAAFSGAMSGSNVPFTSGVATPTSAISTAKGSGSSSAGAVRALETGAMGLAALFGGAAAMFNL